MLHTLSPLAGGSPHNGLQIIHSVRCTLQDATHLIHFLQPFSHRTPRALLPFYYIAVNFKNKLCN
jgi:hypothetical protein